MSASTQSCRSIVTLSSNTTIDEVVAILRRDGGVIIEDMLDDDVLGQFNADLEPFLSRVLMVKRASRELRPSVARRSLRSPWQRLIF